MSKKIKVMGDVRCDDGKNYPLDVYYLEDDMINADFFDFVLELTEKKMNKQLKPDCSYTAKEAICSITKD